MAFELRSMPASHKWKRIFGLILSCEVLKTSCHAQIPRNGNKTVDYWQKSPNYEVSFVPLWMTLILLWSVPSVLTYLFVICLQFNVKMCSIMASQKNQGTKGKCEVEPIYLKKKSRKYASICEKNWFVPGLSQFVAKSVRILSLLRVCHVSNRNHFNQNLRSHGKINFYIERTTIKNDFSKV